MWEDSGAILPQPIQFFLQLRIDSDDSVAYGGVEIEKIEMESMAQCNEQARIWLNSDNIKHDKKYRGYECLTGK